MMERPLTRREEYAQATREALLHSATTLFATRGFAHTSLEDVAVTARVTKGAVYHYFASKQALFQAVLERMDQQTMALIAARSETSASAWDATVTGLDAFLDRCLDRDYQQICFRDGPGALGFVRWWEHGEAHVEGLLRGLLERLRSEGLIATEDLDTLGAALYGAMTAAALSITRSADPQQTRDAMRRILFDIVINLRPATGSRRPRSN